MEIFPLEQWTLWPEESLANRSVTQENEEARKTTVTSGRMLLPFCNDSDPLGCFSKMFLVSSIWRSTWYKLTWKARVTKAGRMYFRLVPSAHRTFGSGSLLWRTPTGTESPARRAPSPMGSAVRLSQQVFANGQIQQVWPTPVARDGKRPGPGSKQLHLSNAVKMVWPTPTSDNAKGTRNFKQDGSTYQEHGTYGPTLIDAVRVWPTPNTGDANGGASTKSNQVQLCYVAAPQPGQNLNPEWVEALMGLPIGWTQLDGLHRLDSHNMPGNRRERSQFSNAAKPEPDA